MTLRYEPRGRGSQSCAANPTVSHASHTTSTRPCDGITARPASNMRAALPDLVAPLALCPRKDRKGAYSHTHSAGFPGTHAGSDECYVFVRESRPVKLCGLCTGAAACGSGGHRRKCTRTETRRKSPEIVHFGGRAHSFPGGGSGSCVAALDSITQEAASAKPGAGRPTGSPPRDTGAKG